MKKIIFLVLASILFVAAITASILVVVYFEIDSVYEILIISGVGVTAILLVLALAFYISATSNAKIAILESRLAKWSSLSPRVNQIGDDAFNNLPVGIIVLDEQTDEVKWNNQYISVFFDEPLVDKRLKDLNQGLEEIYLNKSVQSTVKIKESYFDVSYSPENGVLYLFNASENVKLKAQYQDGLPAIGICTFDALEESSTKLAISSQSALKGEYLNVLVDWLDQFKAYFRALGENRFLIVSNKKQLRRMCQEGFTVLEAVRGISAQHKIRITISMGFASWDVNYEELGSLSQSALDLALRRGGDQVIVNIQNEKIAYFGAKSDATVATSRVTSRFNFDTIKVAMIDAPQIIVQGHTDADYDSFASMIGVYQLAKAIGNQNVYLVVDKDKLDSSVLAIYEQLIDEKVPMVDDFITSKKAIDIVGNDTLVIVVDTQSPELVNTPKILLHPENTFIIDHHRASEKAISGRLFTDPAASSTAELVTELISFCPNPVKLSVIEASLLYAGILVDTNNFTFRTSSKTFDMAAKLVEYGADVIMVKKWLRNDIELIKVLSILVDQAEIYLDRFIITKTEVQNNDRTLLAKVSEQLLEVKGVEAAFTIMKIGKDTVGVSARSYGEINVQVLMEDIGGGGHLNSAAAQIKGKTINEVYNQLKEELATQFDQEGEKVKVILIEDVKNRGKKDDVIEVAPGYALFLKNSKLAIDASEENIKKLDAAKAAKEQDEKNQLAIMNKVKDEIESKKVTLGISVGHDGRAYGSITSKQICDAFEKEFGIAIDKKKVELSSPINSAGIYTATVTLHPQVKASFEVNVVENKV